MHCCVQVRVSSSGIYLSVDLVEAVLAVHDPVLQLALAAQQLVVGAQLAGLQLVDALLDGAVLGLDLLLDLEDSG